ncbi:ATP-binding protein [Winogradskyella sp. 3972H.M.0a.05]|uniref:sensor histidine kinase n=1 Tax=Winogradskyella sp. 3972H.M.0a.05 TaxID=2950277 RepID=UPI0033959B06
MITMNDKATWLYYYGLCKFKTDHHDSAYKHVLNSKILFKELKREKDIADCNILLLNILSHQNDLEFEKSNILSELENYAFKDKDTLALISVYQEIAINYLDNKKSRESLKYFRKIISLYEILGDSLGVAHHNMNIGTVYYSSIKKHDSALFYAKKSVPILMKHKDYQNLSYNYNNQGQYYKTLKEYKSAIEYYKKADSLTLKEFKVKSKVIFYENMSEVFLLSEDYKNAAFYLDKLNILKDSINDTKQNIAISEIKEQYDNATLRAEKAESEASRLESEAKRIQNRNLLFSALGLILFGSITFYLIQKNTKRKQKLAEQEKELETQKLSTVLKEQELMAIDAMIEGQEKERQRIANDLHDDLGGLMATVKLHFNALKDKKSPELYDKTNILIDEAYEKVRSVAHAKNSGVIAKQGLLKAVSNMAEKISASNKISINVLDHGLENRLENSLELTIFRIIQELITNVIKHADASEASIHITNHEDSLNIMIEDNGKGFNPSQITKTKKGMGISSIDKRVEHLNGTMTIESEPNKGTNIIIDIPL